MSSRGAERVVEESPIARGTSSRRTDVARGSYSDPEVHVAAYAGGGVERDYGLTYRLVETVGLDGWRTGMGELVRYSTAVQASGTSLQYRREISTKVLARFNLCRVGVEGLEPTPKQPEKPHFPDKGGAESGALAEIDPALSLIVDAWPAIPANIRAAITALVGIAAPSRPLS